MNDNDIILVKKIFLKGDNEQYLKDIKETDTFIHWWW